MLLRAARRKSHLSTQLPKSLPSVDLHLPWLCPAIGSKRLQSRWSSENPSLRGLDFRKRRNSKDACISAHTRRSLATHVSGTEFHDPDIPWDFEINPDLAHSSHTPKLDMADVLRLRPFDPHKTIMASDATILPPQRIKRLDGIGGEITDMYAVLQGCLCIGRLDRAKAIIKRLGKFNVPMSELITIHVEFFRVAVERIISNPRDSDIQDLHKWFELRIRGQGLDFDYAILAYMLKASLRESSEKKRSRLIRRYMDLLPSDVPEDLQSKFEILTEKEFQYGILTEKELELVESIIQERKIVFDLTTKEQHPAEHELEEMPPAMEQNSLDPPAAMQEDVPEILSTQQKGLGLASLKRSLLLFSEKPSDFDPSQLPYEEQAERQVQIEKSAIISALDRWREENETLTKMGLSTVMQTKNLGARMWKWQLALESYIRKELERIEALEASDSKVGDELDLVNIAVWLQLLPIEQLAAITIIGALTKITKTGVDIGIPLSNLIVHVGKSIEEEHLASQIAKAAKRNPSFANQRKEKFLIKLLKTGRPLPAVDETFNNTHFPSFKTERWSPSTHAKVGAFLITGLIKTATMPVTRVNPKNEEVMTQLQPAFSRVSQMRNGKKVGVLMTNGAIVELLKREPVTSLLAQHLPMVAKPAPWTAFDSGGFLAYPAKAVRVKQNDKDQRHYADIAVQRGDMQQMMKGLDVLGRQSWRINKPVLDTFVQAWNSGLPLAKIPPAHPQFTNPTPPSAHDDPLHRGEYHKAAKAVANQKAAIHSQRCFQNFQVEIARAYKDELFYFPHNMDFRGRAYPIPPIFNHMGADHCRGLLKFGEARELGSAGLKWLKIHLANVFGYDKASLLERERFADDHRDDIYDSASDPLGGKRWWLKSEDAWQTLAACIELKNAWDSPDPEKFMSSLAVHQDGTCNGLQHYAALGGDEWGAKQVNLEPGDKPADVYTAVAELVKESIAKDHAIGNRYAQFLAGRINRKIVKTTVMTNVYGVTWLGAKAQVAKQMKAAYTDLESNPDISIPALAGYVATKIFEALSTMFGGAHHIQTWLGDCANRICSSLTAHQLDQMMQEYERAMARAEMGPKDTRTKKFDVSEICQFKSPVIWTTPLQMPVVQPYRTTKSRRVKTSLQIINLVEPHRSDPVSKRKQLQGFPPNFVHSLDATHMVLSALKCHELGLNFAAVHDSFWTHASDVDNMNEVLRDAFIRIHSEDVIGRMAAEFEVRYKGSFHLVSYKRSSAVTPKITQLRRSKEFKELKEELLGTAKHLQKVFQDTKHDRQMQELIMEKKVADMLQSDDPEVVTRAQKMVTPGRLFIENAADEDVQLPAEFAEMGVGNIPRRQAKAAEVEDSESDATSYESLGNEDVNELEVEDESENMEVEDESESTEPTTEKLNPPKLFDRWATGSVQGNRNKPMPYKDSIASHVWVPLQFPALPKKGKFDVARLKDSKYFFS